MKVRENGWIIGKLPTDEKNCITDVNGVMVGQQSKAHRITKQKRGPLVQAKE